MLNYSINNSEKDRKRKRESKKKQKKRDLDDLWTRYANEAPD